HLHHIEIHIRRQRRRARGHLLGEHRALIQQPGPHPGPLRPLPGKHHHRPHHPGGDPPPHTPRLPPLSPRPPPPHPAPPPRTTHHPDATPAATAATPRSSTTGTTPAANARNAPSSRADTTTATGWDVSGAVVPAAVAAGSSATPSSTTWAFVPLIPKEETAALRGRSLSGQGRASVTSSSAPDDQSTCGEGASTCSVLGTTPRRIASTILITPATPAAACACPMFDLIDPSSSGTSRSCP